MLFYRFTCIKKTKVFNIYKYNVGLRFVCDMYYCLQIHIADIYMKYYGSKIKIFYLIPIIIYQKTLDTMNTLSHILYRKTIKYLC